METAELGTTARVSATTQLVEEREPGGGLTDRTTSGLILIVGVDNVERG